MFSRVVVFSVKTIPCTEEKGAQFPFQRSIKRAYPVQRAPALCGVWGRVSVASIANILLLLYYKATDSNMRSVSLIYHHRKARKDIYFS